MKQKHAKRIAKGLAEFFKDEPEKITLWLLSPNPMFGNYSAAQLICLKENGIDKVAKFVQQSLEQNKVCPHAKSVADNFKKSVKRKKIFNRSGV